MTVQTTIVSSPTYPGNGVTTQFPTGFMFIDDDQVVPVLIDGDGVETDMVAGFTVSGASLATGGTVVTDAPVPTGSSIRIDRRTPLTQDVDVRNLGNFAPRVHMEAWDRLAMQVQEQGAGAIRAPRSAGPGFDGTIRYFDPLRPLVVSADGGGIEGGDTTLTGDMLLRPGLADPDTPGRGAELVAFKQAGTGAVARTLLDKLRENISLRDFGAIGDGTTSDNAALASAVAYAAANNRNVLVPAGVYRLTSTIFVPSGVNLIGEGAQPYTDANSSTASPANGSWLHFDHAGIGLHFVGDSPASASSSLRNVGTMRTHAAPGGGWAPTEYDYDIVVQGVETFLDDVLLLNAYRGVWVVLSGYGRLWTHRLRGQCFREGINLEQSYDTCRIRDSHFWPYWSQHAAVIAWQHANTKVLRIARADNSMISGLFSIYSLTGLEIYGTAEGTAYRLRLSDIDFDSTAYGIHVLDSSDGASLFMSGMGTFGAEGAAAGRGLWIAGDNGRYLLSNTDLSLCPMDGLRVDGTGNAVSSVNTKVRAWNQTASGAAAYEVAAGNLLEFADRPVAEAGGAGPIFGATAGVYKAILGSGLASGTTDGSGELAVTHGLGTTPTGVLLSGVGTGSLQLTCQAVATTTFTIRVMDASGAPVASQPVNVLWEARKA